MKKFKNIACHRCFSKDVIMYENYGAYDGRPGFGCGTCGARWTYGPCGGLYADYVRHREANKKSDLHKYIYKDGEYHK